MEPGLGLFDEGQEQCLELGLTQAHLTAVSFRGDVVWLHRGAFATISY
jgi:hypothetical protein